MLEQMAFIFSQDEIDEHKSTKLQRLKDRLEDVK